MKCNLLWFSFSLYISLSTLVYGLNIFIEEGDGGLTVNRPAVVTWYHEPNDPPGFDFRFVIGEWEDVGLAAANIFVDQPSGDSGEVVVQFPRPGRYVIKAVSGPQFTLIGTSNEVDVSPAPHSTRTLSSSSVLPSSTVSASDSPSSITVTPSRVPDATVSPNVRGGIIAGIVIGTLALVGLLVALVTLFIRRRKQLAHKQDRLSFYPEQMVQRRRSRFLSVPRLILTRASVSGPTDAEHGITPFPYPTSAHQDQVEGSGVRGPRAPLPNASNPFETHSDHLQRTRPLPTPPVSATPPSSNIRPLPVLPPIRGLTESPSLSFHLERHRALPSLTRTERQRQFESRIRRLQEQIQELEQSREGVERVLDDLKRQMEWLEKNAESDWALGLTDVPPPGYARYMTP